MVLPAGVEIGRGQRAGRRGQDQVEAAIEDLPERQRIVITLRDVMGHSSDEVCQMLELSGANQRVLLHRARAAVRGQLASYLEVG